MKKLKCAVIGTGYLGKYHAEKYASLPDAELIAVVDIDQTAARNIAEKHGAQALTDYRELLGQIDAVAEDCRELLRHKLGGGDDARSDLDGPGLAGGDAVGGGQGRVRASAR